MWGGGWGGVGEGETNGCGHGQSSQKSGEKPLSQREEKGGRGVLGVLTLLGGRKGIAGTGVAREKEANHAALRERKK